MSKRLVVLSTDEKQAIRKVLKKWIADQEERPYLSDFENRDLTTIKRAYYNKFKN